MKLAGLVLLAFAGQALSLIQCKEFVPVTWKSPAARIYIYYFGLKDSLPTLPSNASGSDPWRLENPKLPAYPFIGQVCNAPSLNLTSGVYVDSTCSIVQQGTPCYVIKRDYIQIINGLNGLCLTQRHFNATKTELDFLPCNPFAKDARQLFYADSEIECESSDPTKPAGCGKPDEPLIYLYPPVAVLQYGNNWMFDVEKDNVTLIASHVPRKDGGQLTVRWKKLFDSE